MPPPRGWSPNFGSSEHTNRKNRNSADVESAEFLFHGDRLTLPHRRGALLEPIANLNRAVVVKISKMVRRGPERIAENPKPAVSRKGPDRHESRTG